MGAHFKSNNKTLMGEIASFLNKKLSGIGAPSQPAALENAQEEGEEDDEDEEDEGAPDRQRRLRNGTGRRRPRGGQGRDHRPSRQGAGGVKEGERTGRTAQEEERTCSWKRKGAGFPRGGSGCVR